MTLQRRLTILQHNVQSWTTNKNNLYNTYRLHDPDIILLNSTGQTTNHPPIKLYNYRTYTKNRHDRPHAGVAIAIKDNIQHTFYDNYDTDILTVTIQTNLGPIDISTTYIPPRQGYLYAPDLLKILNSPRQSIIIGDFNARHPDFNYRDNNTTGNHLHDLIQLTDARHIGPHFPTFLRHNSATSPDLIITNRHMTANTHAQPGPLTGSDHLPILLTLSTDPILIPIKPRPSYVQANWDGYTNDLSTHPIIDLQDGTLQDIDNAIDQVTTQIKDATERHIPTVRHRPIPYPRLNDNVRQ